MPRPHPSRPAAALGSEPLTPHEEDLLRRLLAGTANKAVAGALGVSLRTVERRRAAALRKLGVETLVAASRLPLFAPVPSTVPAPAAGAEDVLSGVWREAACGFLLVGLDGRILAANDAFFRLLGRGEADLRATDLASVTHPDDRDRDAARNQAFFAGEFPTFRAEKRYVRPEGAAVVVHLVGALVYGPDGRPRSAFGTAVPAG